MSALHIWPEEPRRDGAQIEASALIEGPGSERRVLWFRIPDACREYLASTSDPFVVGAVFLLMRLGLDVRVHGQVSPSLLRNLSEFQAAWAAMGHNFVCVDIDADIEKEPEIRAGQEPLAIMAFSGGVDSCFTAFRHATGSYIKAPRKLAAGVMVHGFDIPLTDGDTFTSAAARSERLLSSLGVELLQMATNFREVVGDWSYSHGSAIAACMHLFSGAFSDGLIGQTFTYGELRQVVEGVNALTDPLLSSDSFRIIPDGAAYTRSDKILAMSGWKEFLHDLRVCWEGPQKDRNCCACEKCMRNILTFRALGLGCPPCFDSDIEDGQVGTLRMGDAARANLRYGKLVAVAKARGTEGSWSRILERRLAAERRAQRSGVIRFVRRARAAAAVRWARLRRAGA